MLGAAGDGSLEQPGSGRTRVNTEKDTVEDRPPNQIVGRTLQRLRKRRDWTLAEAAERTGVPASTLSKIENHQSSPRYDVLVRLAEGLDVSVIEFVKGESFSAIASGARAITRAGDGVPFETPVGTYQYHGGDLTMKSMHPSVIRVPGARSTPEAMSSHGGEEFLYVLHGSVKFFMTPYRPVVLAQGDSVYFDSLMPHAVAAEGEEQAWVLAISMFDQKNAESSTDPGATEVRDPEGGGRTQE